MVTQVTKRVVNTGEIGNASTGDILFDGGVKLNENFDSVYNTFGDQRLYEDDEGEGTQLLHATGYWQKPVNSNAYVAPVPNGSQWDIDATAGSINVTLSKGKRGEGVSFINSNGTISPNSPLIIRPTDSFRGLPAELRVITPYVKVVCWCISDADGVSVWDYSIESMFGQKYIPLDRTYSLSSTSRSIRIAHSSEFNFIKLVLTAATTDGTKIKSSEHNLVIDATNKVVYSTEYASIIIGATSQTDEIYELSFTIDANDYVALTARSTIGGIRLAAKVLNTQKIGVAE